jgi:hypothetical protein
MKPAATADTLDSYVSSATSALGVACESAWLPEIRNNLRITLLHAKLVAQFELPDEAEPAPVFRT